MTEKLIKNDSVEIFKSKECFENCSVMANLQPKDILTVTNQLRLKTNYYREEIAKMEAVFLKLGLNNHQCCMEMIDKLNRLQEDLNSEDLSFDSAILSHSHQLRKNNNYLAKLKVCIKLYLHLNENLSKSIKTLRCEFEQSKVELDRLLTITSEEVKVMEGKIQRYENELIKLEKKYPWLKNSNYDLPNISKATSLLNELKRKKIQLMEELKIYHGLKPDLGEAMEQVNQIKTNYQELSSKLINDMKK